MGSASNRRCTYIIVHARWHGCTCFRFIATLFLSYICARGGRYLKVCQTPSRRENKSWITCLLWNSFPPSDSSVSYPSCTICTVDSVIPPLHTSLGLKQIHFYLVRKSYFSLYHASINQRFLSRELWRIFRVTSDQSRSPTLALLHIV